MLRMTWTSSLALLFLLDGRKVVEEIRALILEKTACTVDYNTLRKTMAFLANNTEYVTEEKGRNLGRKRHYEITAAGIDYLRANKILNLVCDKMNELKK